MRGSVSTRAVAVLTAGLLLAACSPDKTAQVEKPLKGGNLIEALVRPSNDDPALANTVSERVIADQLYDGLTTWDTQTHAARPALADRWEPSGDLKQWTFHLRDAKAGNGDSITATDVKKSLEHIARKSANSSYRDLLSNVVGFDDFSGNDAVPDLAGVVAVDPTTVRIDLTSPSAELPRLLGNPAFGIVHAATDGSSVTTGPFTIKDKTDPNNIRLVRAGGSSALLDAVEMHYFDDADAAYKAFEKGNAQWSIVPPSVVDAAGDRFGRNLYRPSLRTVSIAFNTQSNKLKDPRFRQAIIRAIDRRAVVDKMNLGDATVLNGIVPDGVPGAQAGGCGPGCTFDTDAAKAQVGQVFGTNPAPSLTLDVAAGAPFTDPATQQIVGDLAKVGVAVTPKTTDGMKYGDITVSPQREMFQTSWSAAYPSPDAFIGPLFSSGSTSNVFALQNKEIDDKIGAAQNERNPGKRMTDWQEIERNVMAQYPLIPLAQFGTDSVAVSIVRGLDPQPTGNFDASAVWLSAKSTAKP